MRLHLTVETASPAGAWFKRLAPAKQQEYLALHHHKPSSRGDANQKNKGLRDFHKEQHNYHAHQLLAAQKAGDRTKQDHHYNLANAHEKLADTHNRRIRHGVTGGLGETATLHEDHAARAQQHASAASHHNNLSRGGVKEHTKAATLHTRASNAHKTAARAHASNAGNAGQLGEAADKASRTAQTHEHTLHANARHREFAAAGEEEFAPQDSTLKHPMTAHKLRPHFEELSDMLRVTTFLSPLQREKIKEADDYIKRHGKPARSLYYRGMVFRKDDARAKKFLTPGNGRIDTGYMYVASSKDAAAEYAVPWQNRDKMIGVIFTLHVRTPLTVVKGDDYDEWALPRQCHIKVRSIRDLRNKDPDMHDYEVEADLVQVKKPVYPGQPEVASDDNLVYQPLLRPAGFSTLPHGIQWEYVEAPSSITGRPDLPNSRFPHGLIRLGRPLTDDEQDHFSLRPMVKVGAVWNPANGRSEMGNYVGMSSSRALSNPPRQSGRPFGDISEWKEAVLEQTMEAQFFTRGSYSYAVHPETDQVVGVWMPSTKTGTLTLL